MLWIAGRKNLLHAAPNQRQPHSALLPDLARQECHRALQREPAGLVVQVELIFVRQRRPVIAREEQALDPNAATCKLICERDRLRQQRITVAGRNEGGRELRCYMVEHPGRRKAWIVLEILATA